MNEKLVEMLATSGMNRLIYDTTDGAETFLKLMELPGKTRMRVMRTAVGCRVGIAHIEAFDNAIKNKRIRKSNLQ